MIIRELLFMGWSSPRRELNPQPCAYKTGGLPFKTTRVVDVLNIGFPILLFNLRCSYITWIKWLRIKYSTEKAVWNTYGEGNIFVVHSHRQTIRESIVLFCRFNLAQAHLYLKTKNSFYIRFFIAFTKNCLFTSCLVNWRNCPELLLLFLSNSKTNE